MEVESNSSNKVTRNRDLSSLYSFSCMHAPCDPLLRYILCSLFIIIPKRLNCPNLSLNTMQFFFISRLHFGICSPSSFISIQLIPTVTHVLEGRLDQSISIVDMKKSIYEYQESIKRKLTRTNIIGLIEGINNAVTSMVQKLSFNCPNDE